MKIFKEKIDELDFEKLKVDKIKSLKDYFRLEKHFLVLKQYKEAYFPYIQMETNYYPQNELIEIINKYNMLSSSKSTIDNSPIPALTRASAQKPPTPPKPKTATCFKERRY